MSLNTEECVCPSAKRARFASMGRDSRNLRFYTACETACDGAVRVYNIVPIENEVNLLALFVTKRDHIEVLMP